MENRGALPPANQGLGTTMGKIRVFVSYDREHDEDLYDLLAEQASKATSGFEIFARSRPRGVTDLRSQGLRREIRSADEIIILCGEHTDCSERVGIELQITQEEKRPYFMLWGRRELMCTKPATARTVDAMYSWTWQVVQNQLLTLRREAASNEPTAELRSARATPKT